MITHVTNTVTNAVTLFENYSFNSMCHFNGMYLGASAAGIAQLDDPTSVEARSGILSTGQMHFGSEMQKRVSDFYLAMRSKGDVTLRVSTDELDPYEYTVDPLTVERLNQRRSWIGKGARGKYWRFELECADDFDYDTMNIGVVVTSRRV